MLTVNSFDASVPSSCGAVIFLVTFTGGSAQGIEVSFRLTMLSECPFSQGPVTGLVLEILSTL